MEMHHENNILVETRTSAKFVLIGLALLAGLALVIRYGNYEVLDRVVMALYPVYVVAVIVIVPGLRYVFGEDGITVTQDMGVHGIFTFRSHTSVVKWSDIEWVHSGSESFIPPKLFFVKSRQGSRRRTIILSSMMTNVNKALIMLSGRVPLHRLDDRVIKYVNSKRS